MSPISPKCFNLALIPYVAYLLYLNANQVEKWVKILFSLLLQKDSSVSVSIYITLNMKHVQSSSVTRTATNLLPIYIHPPHEEKPSMLTTSILAGVLLIPICLLDNILYVPFKTISSTLSFG